MDLKNVVKDIEALTDRLISLIFIFLCFVVIKIFWWVIFKEQSLAIYNYFMEFDIIKKIINPSISFYFCNILLSIFILNRVILQFLEKYDRATKEYNFIGKFVAIIIILYLVNLLVCVFLFANIWYLILHFVFLVFILLLMFKFTEIYSN